LRRRGQDNREIGGEHEEGTGTTLDGMAEDGDPLPKPGGVESYRDVMKDLDLEQYVLAHVQIETSRFAVLANQS
jgi:hypothetical protein